jgi:hypothetical protein
MINLIFKALLLHVASHFLLKSEKRASFRNPVPPVLKHTLTGSESYLDSSFHILVLQHLLIKNIFSHPESPISLQLQPKIFFSIFHLIFGLKHRSLQLYRSMEE